MTKKTTTIKDEEGRDVPVTIGPDVDLDAEEIYDSRGRRIDERYVQDAVETAHAALPGRPSLSGGRGEHSPQVSFRVPAALRARAQRRADAEGKTLSELAREAFDRYLRAS
ncbi:MAG TPA: hypothetical protein VII16_03075 [Actinomycetes bacterium]|jgi:hypothetical protein